MNGIGVDQFTYTRPVGTARAVTEAEIAVLSVADECGLPATIDVSELLEFVRRIVGNVNQPPLMWVMQSRLGATVTHYKHVADEFARREGWTVTPIYSRVS